MFCFNVGETFKILSSTPVFACILKSDSIGCFSHEPYGKSLMGILLGLSLAWDLNGSFY